MQTVFSFLPKKISELMLKMSPEKWEHIEEIRIRVGRPVEISAGGQYEILPLIVKEDDAEQLLSNLTHFSMYTMEEELKRGYITIEGGHRVGIAGKVILNRGDVKAIIHISSFNIRIAKEKIGCAEQLIPYLYRNGWKNTILIGPPQTGKTTLIRDIARMISSGISERKILASKVGIVDERSEIAGCVKGVPQLQFGPRIDVLDACPKAEGMMMLIRSMSPNVIIADEIGRIEDAESALEAVNAGIKLIVTVHGNSLEDILKRPTIQRMINLKVFERFVVLKRSETNGFHFQVNDEDGKLLTRERGVQV